MLFTKYIAHTVYEKYIEHKNNKTFYNSSKILIELFETCFYVEKC